MLDVNQLTPSEQPKKDSEVAEETQVIVLAQLRQVAKEIVEVNPQVRSSNVG